MIVDSSAIVAILMGEPEAGFFKRVLADTENLRLSAATLVELFNVLDRRVGDSALEDLDRLIDESGIEIAAFTVDQVRWARHARLTYGVGRHPANLNFGDCFPYALAKATGEPLLFKGDDFSHTDVVPVGPPP